MHPMSTPAKVLLLVATLLVSSGLSTAVTAQTATVVYDLEDVWLLPDVSRPGSPAQQMTGTFEWTYTVGEFDDGSGEFLEVNIPWYGTALAALNITVEPKSMEFVLPGNFHDTGLDLTLFLQPSLSACQVSAVDTLRSSFDIQQNGRTYKGRVISGSIVPACSPPSSGPREFRGPPPNFGAPQSWDLPLNYGGGSPGVGGFVPSITHSGGEPHLGNTAFSIDCARLPGGASCFMLLGFGKDRFRFGGVDILVDPGAWIVIPRRAGGSSGVPGAGVLEIPLPIPDDPRIAGMEIDVQVLALDPDLSTGIAAASNGLAIIIRPRQ